MNQVLIVGAGQAGGETAGELRRLGFAGEITLLGDEPQVPYRRPPLSKAFLAGTATQESLYVTPLAALEKARIRFIGGIRAERIDCAARKVELKDGRSLVYDKLVLATGGRARSLTILGADKPNVLPLRSIADVEALHRFFQPGQRAVIVGGGFIGLEVAAVAVKHGLRVTVLEGLPRVLARVTSPEVSAFFERVHREAGVDLRTGVQIGHFEGDAAVEAVVLADGTRIAADFVVVGIGQLPNGELADAAGIAVDNGIVVDEFCRTSDPDIYAVGDCASHPNKMYGRRLRLESVQNAVEQGRAAAASILGKAQPYDIAPWFWSDQYDLKLQMVGLSAGFQTLVLRGDPAGRSFAAFYLDGDGRVIAADAVNRPQDFMFAKKVVSARGKVDVNQLRDEALPLKQLAMAA